MTAPTTAVILLMSWISVKKGERMRELKRRHKCTYIKHKKSESCLLKHKNNGDQHNVLIQIEFLESPQPLCPTGPPLPEGDYWLSSSCCRNQGALFPVVCWTVLSWVFPRNDQMRGIWGKAGTVPGEGWWEQEEEGRRRGGWNGGIGEEEGSGLKEQQGLVFLEKPFCFWQ